MAKNLNVLGELLDWVVAIDIEAIKAAIAEQRLRYPNDSNSDLADRAFFDARWKSAMTGLATGLPANPWIAMPAASVDAAYTLKSEIAAAAHTAMLFDPQFFDDQQARWELLIPVLGIGASSQLLRSLGMKGGVEVTRAVLHKYLQKEGLRSFRQVMLKYFGMRVTKRGILTKTVPIVGGLIGGGWNYIEVGRIHRRTLAYLAERRTQRLETDTPADRIDSEIVSQPN